MHLKSERNTGVYREERSKTRVAYQNGRCKSRFERNTIKMTKMPIWRKKKDTNQHHRHKKVRDCSYRNNPSLTLTIKNILLVGNLFVLHIDLPWFYF